MKRFLTLAFSFAFLAPWVVAQDNTDPWQKKKAESFRPLTDAQKSAIETAVPAEAVAKPKKARRVLMFYRCEGFIHGSIPYGNYAVEAMAKKTNAFTVDLADTYDVFTPENLAKY
ncbi:MAG: hypothetical protein ACKOCH_14510, partial [Bacteroidota bacterium]